MEAGDALVVAGVGTTPLFDQRGMPFGRVVDGDGAGGPRVDIGSFEAGVPAPALLGDYTRDGTVDAADFVLWRNTLGQSVSAYSGADGSGNGAVGGEDYYVWTAHFGASSGAAAGSGQAFDSLAELVVVQSTETEGLVAIESLQGRSTASPASTAQLSVILNQTAGLKNKLLRHNSQSSAYDLKSNLLVLSLSVAGDAGNDQAESTRLIGSDDIENEAALERAIEECFSGVWSPWSGQHDA
jgi:hypothetical protein